MTEASAASMHPEFNKWYREVSLDDNPARLEARWEGVLAVISEPNREVIDTLVRLAFRARPAPASTTLENVRQDFKDADEAFEMRGNDREMEVLAGTCLAVLMGSGQAGASAALAVTTASLAGARNPVVPMELVTLAESTIKTISDVSRRRPALTEALSFEAPKISFEAASAKIKETPDFNGINQAIVLMAADMTSAITKLSRRQATNIRAVENFIQVQDEELQMLWWLTGGRSTDLKCAFDAVPSDAQALVFASELADATQGLPGPASIRGILSRAGLKERKKLTIPTAVNAADATWLREFDREPLPSAVTTPIHFAISRYMETGAGNGWVAGWAGAAELDAGHSLSALTLGDLFYRERLLQLFD